MECGQCKFFCSVQKVNPKLGFCINCKSRKNLTLKNSIYFNEPSCEEFKGKNDNNPTTQVLNMFLNRKE